MKTLEQIFAGKLLKVKAIKLQPTNPFTWASGWKSPFYCDNRKTLSYPELRSFVKLETARIIMERFPEVDAIAGVATGAIPQGALVAQEMGLPFCYVRSEAKSHGLNNQVEGIVPQGASVVVIEDLVSTGKSSLAAVEALREKGASVKGMMAIFTYQLDAATEAFNKANCDLVTISNYESLIQKAVEENYVSDDQMQSLIEWRKSPQAWSDAHQK